MDNTTPTIPEISILDGYSDATHIFGICFILRDGLDKYGRTEGTPDATGRYSIRREYMTKQQAIDWITSAAEDNMNVDAFRIVATRRNLWETVEAGPRNSFTPAVGKG